MCLCCSFSKFLTESFYVRLLLWCYSGSRSNKTFKPKKNIPEGTHQYDLMRHAAATLGSGNLRLAVMLPEGEDLNEWVAVNSETKHSSIIVSKFPWTVSTVGVFVLFYQFLWLIVSLCSTYWVLTVTGRRGISGHSHHYVNNCVHPLLHANNIMVISLLSWEIGYWSVNYEHYEVKRER